MKKNARLLAVLAMVSLTQLACENDLSHYEIPVLENVNNEVHYATGYIPSTKEQLDELKVLKESANTRRMAIPDQYMLQDLPVALDQGQKGACVAYAIAHARTIQNIEPKLLVDNQPNYAAYASPEYLYEKYKFANNCSNGVFFLDALDALKADGTSSQDLTGVLPCGVQPSAMEEKNISKFRINDYYRLNIISKDNESNLIKIKEQIAQGIPVIIGLSIDTDFTKINGIWRNKVWDVNTSAFYGNHAVVIVGYDDTKKMFKLLNSWGSTWGNNGYCWVTYDKLAQELGPDTFVMRVNNPLTYHSANKPFVYLNKDVSSLSDNIEISTANFSTYMNNSTFNWGQSDINNSYSQFSNPSLVLKYSTASNEVLPTDDLRFEIRIKMKSSKLTTYPSYMQQGMEFQISDGQGKSIYCNIPVNGKQTSIFRNSQGELKNINIYPQTNFDTEDRFVTIRFNIKNGRFYYGENFIVKPSQFPSGVSKMNSFSVRFVGTIGVIDDIRVYSDQKQIGIDHMDGNITTSPMPWLQWFI